MGEVNVESHNTGPTLYQPISRSFHVDRPSHSSDTTFSKFDLENPVKLTVKVKVESDKLSVTSYLLTPLYFHVNRPFHVWYKMVEIFHG